VTPFPWRAGMRCYNRDFETPCRIVAILDGEALAVHENTDCPLGFTDDLSNFSGADLTDAATSGALLGAVREAYKDPDIHAEPANEGLPIWWGVYVGNSDRVLASGPTEGAALLAAWEAAP